MNPVASPVSVSNDASTLRKSVERALALGGHSVARLGSAGTSVTFLVAGDDAQSFTLLLDRQPPEVVDASEPAEIALELQAGHARAFARGVLVIPNSLVMGEIGYRGPVRKYLHYDPILRALLAEASRSSD